MASQNADSELNVFTQNYVLLEVTTLHLKGQREHGNLVPRFIDPLIIYGPQRVWSSQPVIFDNCFLYLLTH